MENYQWVRQVSVPYALHVFRVECRVAQDHHGADGFVLVRPNFFTEDAVEQMWVELLGFTCAQNQISDLVRHALVRKGAHVRRER